MTKHLLTLDPHVNPKSNTPKPLNHGQTSMNAVKCDQSLQPKPRLLVLLLGLQQSGASKLMHPSLGLGFRLREVRARI